MPWRSRFAWAWTLVIFLLCWIPRNYLSEQERLPKPLFIPNFDKLIHLGIFAIFSVLWMRAGTSSRRAWWILLAGVAVAFITEIGQELPVVNRDASLADGLADFAGVVVGLVGYGVLGKILEKRAVPAAE